jgi:hypothetical protein
MAIVFLLIVKIFKTEAASRGQLEQAFQCCHIDDPEANNGQEALPVLSGLDLTLTTEQIFAW